MCVVEAFLQRARAWSRCESGVSGNVEYGKLMTKPGFVQAAQK